MRKELAAEEGKRKRFKAVFSGVGKKVNYKGYREQTILLRNIVDLESNKVVADHVWFSCLCKYLHNFPYDNKLVM